MIYCTAAAAECSYLLINRCTHMVDLILKGEVLVNNEAKITRCGRRSNIDTTAFVVDLAWKTFMNAIITWPAEG